jgi:hypothetical protein
MGAIIGIGEIPVNLFIVKDQGIVIIRSYSYFISLKYEGTFFKGC